ncbi:MAG: SDR family oxidoreductase [Alistipes sp.]|nr:SDR family oxidoreductase [Alistipes sp.]
MEKRKLMVVTGASSGIGFHTALKAQQQGFDVVWASRRIESDEKVRSVCGVNSVCRNVDVASEESVAELFKFVGETYGHMDILVNCAGFVDPQSMLATTLENWERTIKVNLTGTFLCCKAATLLMKNRGGKIINIASTAGLTPRPGWSAYAASKSGVINFSESIAEELAPYGIKVFMICPGRTATPLRKILVPNEDPTTIMQPQTVADTILFCCTDEADCMEGQPILVRERF